MFSALVGIPRPSEEAADEPPRTHEPRQDEPRQDEPRQDEPRQDEPARRGRILLRVSPELHETLARAAEDQGVSLNAYLAESLARRAGVIEGRHEFERWMARALGRPLAWRWIAGLARPPWMPRKDRDAVGDRVRGEDRDAAGEGQR